MLACVLRPSSRDPASVVGALIKLLAARLRQAWPEVRLIARADGLCRPRVLRRLEAWDIRYVMIGLPNPHISPRTRPCGSTWAYSSPAGL